MYVGLYDRSGTVLWLNDRGTHEAEDIYCRHKLWDFAADTETAEQCKAAFGRALIGDTTTFVGEFLRNPEEIGRFGVKVEPCPALQEVAVIVTAHRFPSSLKLLSDRELSVVSLLITAETDEEIGEFLKIETSTARSFKYRAAKKLGLTSGELLRFAIRHEAAVVAEMQARLS